MNFSTFGARFSGRSGARDRMDDPGAVARDPSRWSNLGDGNPRAVPALQALFDEATGTIGARSGWASLYGGSAKPGSGALRQPGATGGEQQVFQARDALETGSQRCPLAGAPAGRAAVIQTQASFQFTDPRHDRRALGVGERHFDTDFEAVRQFVNEHDRADKALQPLAQRYCKFQGRADRNGAGRVEAQPEVVTSVRRQQQAPPA